MIPAVSLRGRDFLDVGDLDPAELRSVLVHAHAIKAGRWAERPLEGRHVAMLFQKPSHRTRVSFEVGIARLGGTTTSLGEHDVQLGRRESIADAARVLDRYVDLIVARMRSHADLVQLAGAAKKPVINALTDRSHPCQILADLMTLEEACGPLGEQQIVYVGDGNNIATSLIEASALLGFRLTVISPPGYEPANQVLERAKAIGSGTSQVLVSNDVSALDGATAVYTDVWTSMGQEDQTAARRRVFAPYQVNQRLMDAAKGAVFLHCLPAHRGEEVTDEVIDGPRSIVFDQAGNRLYAQMALMAEIMGTEK
ncbi:MAG: ornithine carbamoyltransferase [Chloroflexi bacterium 13_1_40CM_3_65_12]|nr:MAG: ornithine carbamoyltransferase [Chloroflexi bacterium 13_1_40CM_65_17]OLC48806.1 MAG: ornithine carbamoyltransferase [Chloroflexi bacterium 13_1_40CM_4_65_13]OLD27106.1 MAG: ornithine carbamoyltransferase [Chloroflexi bacterium 13_1_40CM_3_65_12]